MKSNLFTRLMNLPEEILNIILEMDGHIQHKKRFDRLQNSLQLSALQWKIREISRNFNDRTERQDIFYIIGKYIDPNDIENIIRLTNICNCCPRHQKHRPREIIEIGYRERCNHSIKSCICQCRHLNRYLCRFYTTRI